MTKNFPKLTQETQRTTIRKNTEKKKSAHRHITFKLQNSRDKEKVLKY